MAPTDTATSVLVPPNSELATTWRAELLPDVTWRPTPNQAGVLGGVQHGEAGGLFVSADRWPMRRAYMKPRKKDPRPTCARAAREKICADLAYEVRFNVPPVVLAHRHDAPTEEERACSVSLVKPNRREYTGDSALPARHGRGN